ncbi:MAG: hypothetical protein MUC94_12475 [bacterium]|nr:hypothetical protein [bacterium]
MTTLRIELEVHVEDSIAKLYHQVSEDVKRQLSRNLTSWLKDYLGVIETESEVDKNWLEFLDNIDEFSVDTGIEDYSINHEHYLYGGPKRS